MADFSVYTIVFCKRNVKTNVDILVKIIVENFLTCLRNVVVAVVYNPFVSPWLSTRQLTDQCASMTNDSSRSYTGLGLATNMGS